MAGGIGSWLWLCGWGAGVQRGRPIAAGDPHLHRAWPDCYGGWCLTFVLRMSGGRVELGGVEGELARREVKTNDASL